MRSLWAAVGILALASACATTPIAGQDARVIRAKNRVAPSLVHIVPVKEVFHGGRREDVVVQGSGFIISPDGYVATNEHVAGESKRVKCILQTKEELEADVVGVDPDTDIAVLKLRTNRTDFPAVEFGSRKPEAGETVLAMGSPHGLARSVSTGIVSVTDRYLPDQSEHFAPYTSWIQTDAAINPGNSGGPLVNLRGEVVGINARKLTNADNVGFAIPIDQAQEVIRALIEHGKVARSWIGISVQEMMRKTDDPSQKGVVIADVDPLSPAAEAGIRPGDVLLSVNGTPTDARYVEGLPSVRRIIAGLPVGSEAALRIARDGEARDVTVTTVEKTEAKGQQTEFTRWGFSATNVTPLVARQAQLPALTGVLVSGVQVGSIAANAGLQPGDLILRVEGRDVPDMEAFKSIYEGIVASGQRLVLLDVKRGAFARFVLVKQSGEPTAAEAPADIPAAPEGAEPHVE
jgi:serine protease Do